MGGAACLSSGHCSEHVVSTSYQSGFSFVKATSTRSDISLCAGLFIYVGSVGIVAEEFAKYEDPAFAATRPRGARFYMFAALFFGFVSAATRPHQMAVRDYVGVEIAAITCGAPTGPACALDTKRVRTVPRQR